MGKKINPTYFIFCEGKTELAYIKYLKRKYRFASIAIDSVKKGNAISKQFIENYKKDKFTDDKDLDFLMYDIDAPRMLEKLEAIPDTILLSSNPCIELWFLLHHKNQKANIKTVDCIREIKNRCSGYEKSNLCRPLIKKLEESESKAIKRAKELNKNQNPSSNVNVLVKSLSVLINNVPYPSLHFCIFITHENTVSRHRWGFKF